MEQRLNMLYREIVETVNEMIPEEWEKFYFYAQISESGGGTYFFYNTPENRQCFNYSVKIPYKFAIEKDEYKNNKRKLFELCDELRNVFNDNQQQLWYSFTMSLENSGEFKIHFDYTSWLDTEYSFSDQMIIWKNKYLGEVPSDKNNKILIEKYFSEYPDNPI